MYDDENSQDKSGQVVTTSNPIEATYEKVRERMVEEIQMHCPRFGQHDAALASVTHEHEKRVVLLAMHTAPLFKAYSCPPGENAEVCTEEEIIEFCILALFHDIGKNLLDPESQDLLRFAGALSPEQYKQIQEHSAIGANFILNIFPGLSKLAYFVLTHHEEFDGSGYPLGLKGCDIPWQVRAISILDAWDTITSNRPYRPARSEKEALAELERCSTPDADGNCQFDPVMTSAFIQFITQGRHKQVAA